MWEAAGGAARRLLLAPEALLKGDGRMRLTLPYTHRIESSYDELLAQSKISTFLPGH